MSATVTSNVPWINRKRTSDSPPELPIEMKKPRLYHYRLASESSACSDEGTESVYSFQGRETDVVQDTPDTDSRSEDDDQDFEFVEYEVESLSGSDSGQPISSSDPEDQVIFAAALEVMCDNSIENWLTDCEESDNSSLDDTFITRLGFITCIQCKAVNDNPLFRYCEKCFQDRKKIYPPRPRGNRKSKKKTPEPHVELDTLRSYLSGMSQDSGLGSSSSQECPPLDLDQIVVPDKHLKQGTSLSDVKGTLQMDSVAKEHNRPLRRKRQASESSLSDFEIKKLKYTRPESRSSRTSSRKSARGGSTCQTVTENSVSSSQDQPISSQIDNKSSSLCQTLSNDDISLSQSSTDTCVSQSQTSTCLSSIERPISEEIIKPKSPELSSVSSSQSFSEINLQVNTNSGSDSAQSSELCIICNVAPKDSIFLHTNTGHQCCCYKCAKRTLHTIKRCPICNRSVSKVVKIFKT